MAKKWYDPFEQGSSTKPKPVNTGSLFAPNKNKPSTGVYVSTVSQPYSGPKPASVSVGLSPEERRAQNIGALPQMTSLSPEAEANRILGALDALSGLGTPTPKAGDGLTSQQRMAMQAIKTLQGRLGAPSETDALQARLADIYKQAEDRIRAAGAELSGSLSTPTATRTVAPATPVGSVAMSDYLNALGASGADVSAQQALSNAILNSIAGNAQQYAGGLTQANEAVRQALAGAVPANQLAGISQASLNRAALESRLASQRSQERQAIQDQILELALKYGVNL